MICRPRRQCRFFDHPIATMKTLSILVAGALLAGSGFAQAPYRDSSLPVDQRVEDLLGRMTLEEKVAQLQGFRSDDPQAWDNQGNFVGGKDAAVLSRGVGSLYSTGGLQPGQLFRLTPRQTAQRINGIQKFLAEKTRLGIPGFVFGEALHGFMSTGATSFPQAIALGSTWDLALVEQVFTATALEASARGTRQVLSPVLDLARDPRWGRTEECYSEDPYLVAQMAKAAIFGLQGRTPAIDQHHVAVTLKHFAGHGQPEGGRNIAPVNYSEREFRESHLYPFEVAVRQANARSIMASYNEWDGVPNHVNHKLLTEILRDEWGFRGFVMSDGGGLDVLVENHHVAASLVPAGLLSLEAGLDYDLHSKGAFTSLAEEVKAGRISEEVINRSVRNILRMKFECGLFENPFADIDLVEQVTNNPAHKALALQAAREAMVLLKNDRHVLPFDAAKIKTLAVIGPNAADIHLGGYSAVPMQGVSVLAGLKESAGAAIEIRYAEGCKLTLNKKCDWRVNENPILSDPAEDRKLIAAAVAVAAQSDAVVLVLGNNELLDREAWSEDHLGDADSLDLVGRQNELAAAVLATAKPVAVLLINGRPLSINDIAAHAPAIIECWYLGQETGRAVADVLFGRINPSGKLTVTIPRSVGQLPCYYDHKPSRFRRYVATDSVPLFPFGFGLSYTTFEYKNLKVTPAGIAPDGTVQVSLEVSNTGSMPGDEVVQLYLHDIISLPTRPVAELKDFTRVPLAQGETRTVTFTLTPEKLAALGLDMKPVVQPGDFEVMVGRSSVDYLKTTLTVR
jgi:beta-glucosidase